MQGKSLSRKLLEIGGLAAGVILVAFGAAAIVMGFNGRQTVNDNLKLEQIVGTSDMTPSAIRKEANSAGLTNINFPTASVAGKSINNGTRAHQFAGYMRIHTLESSGGYTYSQMGRYQAKPGAPADQLAKGGGTDNAMYAVIDAKGQPVANATRDLWVTETALTSALNLAYMAQQVALFGIVVGFALLLTGIGFLVLTLAGALKPVPVPETEKAKGPGLVTAEPTTV